MLVAVVVSMMIFLMAIVKNIIKTLLISFFALSILITLIFKWFPVPITPLMVIRAVQQSKAGKDWQIKQEWVSLDDMSVYMPVAVIASEDQRFMQHRGFDLDAINSAVKERVQGKRLRGGSTISQQTAKNVFLWPESSWLRKGFEVYFTFLIELLWSKERIMEVYLNIIEMGDGIYGLEAVAQENFSCSAKALSRSQCALIAATIPNPLRFKSDAPTPYVRQRQQWIKKQMKSVPLFERKTDESFDDKK